VIADSSEVLCFDQGVDLFAVRHRRQVAPSCSHQGAARRTLINSLLQAATGKESSEIAGGKAVSGSNGVDRSDGKPA
jgi:hypothetical protein